VAACAVVVPAVGIRPFSVRPSVRTERAIRVESVRMRWPLSYSINASADVFFGDHPKREPAAYQISHEVWPPSRFRMEI
jgi:hypothetical protein